jgi:hypothetical protein
MKSVTKTSFIFLMSTLIPCQAMEAEPGKEKRLEITPAMVEAHEATFKRFIQELEEKKWPKLQRMPDPDSWTGWAIVGAVNFFMKSFTRYGEVRPKETGIFLGRVFATERTEEEEYEIPRVLQQGINRLKEGGSEYLDYVNGVIEQLDKTTLQKRNLARLAEVMDKEKRKYPHMPGAHNMSNKEEVPDEVFAPFAAAQLFTTCCVEEKLLLRDRGIKHSHNRSKKRRSIIT